MVKYEKRLNKEYYYVSQEMIGSLKTKVGTMEQVLFVNSKK